MFFTEKYQTFVFGSATADNLVIMHGTLWMGKELLVNFLRDSERAPQFSPRFTFEWHEESTLVNSLILIIIIFHQVK